MEIKDVKIGDVLLNKEKLQYFLVIFKDDTRIIVKASTKSKHNVRIDIRDGIEIDINDVNTLTYIPHMTPMAIRCATFLMNCERVDTLSEDEIELFSILENYAMLAEPKEAIQLSFNDPNMVSDWRKVSKLTTKIRKLGEELMLAQEYFMIRHYPDLYNGIMDEDN